MQSFYVDENLSSRLYQDYSAKLHRQRLDQIKHRNNSTHVNFDPKHNGSKKLNSFSKIAKINEVSRENKILYDRLTLISERKSIPDKSMMKIPRTLNYSMRKKQTEKIIKENQEFIQRLIEKPSQFSLKKFKLDYEMLQKYKENMSKKKILDRINRLVKDHAMPTLIEVPAKNESSPEMKRHRNSSLPDVKVRQNFSFTLEAANKPDTEEVSTQDN